MIIQSANAVGPTFATTTPQMGAPRLEGTTILPKNRMDQTVLALNTGGAQIYYHQALERGFKG